MEELEMRAAKAVCMFLSRRGYDVLETGWECAAGTADIVAEDCNTLIFVKVHARTGAESGFSSEPHGARERAERELVALAYLAEHDQVDVPVRFDDLSLVVLASDRAMIRHHIHSMADDAVLEPEEALSAVA